MFEYSFLQHYWWFIISLLAGILVFLLMVQGGQSMLFSLGKDEKHRHLLVNAFGRKWEYTFTTLVTFGGAFFASFPLFYSTSFGGAYWVWMLILLCFVVQAISYEYMSRPGNTFGSKTYQTFLFINGMFGPFLIGAAVATFFTGAEFSVEKGNIANLGSVEPLGIVISRWQNPLHGLEALGDFRNWLLGFTVLFLVRTNACLYLINRIEQGDLMERTRKYLVYNALPFVVCFLAFVIWILVGEGYAVNPETKEVSLQAYKYLTNLVEMPIVLVFFLLGVVAVLYGIGRTVFQKQFQSGIWFSGIGTVVTVCMLFLLAGYNNTAYYPSSVNPQSSLTIFNSSSSEFTLTAMTYVSILVPFVLAYIFYAWRSLERKKFRAEDLKEDGHVY